MCFYTLGINAQYGQKQFGYNFSLTTHHQSFNATSAMKFSMEHQNPLVTGWAEGELSGNTNNSFSLLSSTNPNVLLWSVKPAEEGIEKGLITRFWNMDSKPVSSIIKVSKPIKKAWQTSHIETNKRKLASQKNSLKIQINQFQLKTYRFLLKAI